MEFKIREAKTVLYNERIVSTNVSFDRKRKEREKNERFEFLNYDIHILLLATMSSEKAHAALKII